MWWLDGYACFHNSLSATVRLERFVRGCTVADMDPSASIQDPPPAALMADISSLVGELQSVPAKELDRNLLLATWNIRESASWPVSGTSRPDTSRYATFTHCAVSARSSRALTSWPSRRSRPTSVHSPS